MPNAIVLNTLTGSVSEYSAFDFHSITPTHGGSVLGLYTLGGNLDVTATIVANVVTPRVLLGTSMKKFVEAVYFSLLGSGTSTMTVLGKAVSNSYKFVVRPSGESRSTPGRGIRENYLAFGYSNTDGADFRLDRIEVLTHQSSTRRI